MKNPLRLIAGTLVAGFLIAGGSLITSLPSSADTTPVQPPASTSVACNPGLSGGDTAGTGPSGPVSGPACPNPPTQPGGLDHFLCYPVLSDQFSPPAVIVHDQFGIRGPVQPLPAASTPSTAPNLWCNPAKKILNDVDGVAVGPNYPVTNPKAHLYCYWDTASTDTPVNLQAMVQNQFGTTVLSVGQPTRLCVPSWKYDPNADPANALAAAGSVPPTAWTDPSALALNHFQCYKVVLASAVGSAPHPATVTVHDQFGTFSYTVQDPTQLCAPAIKQAIDPTTGQPGPPSLVNADWPGGAHLLCYPVTMIGTTPGNGHGILAGNQFSQAAPGAVPAAVPVLPAPDATQLCLPSFKTIVNTNTPEVPYAVLLPIAGAGIAAGALLLSRRRARRPQLAA